MRDALLCQGWKKSESLGLIIFYTVRLIFCANELNYYGKGRCSSLKLFVGSLVLFRFIFSRFDNVISVISLASAKSLEIVK